MLRVLQKKAIRIIFSVKYNAHTSNLFDKSKITKVENIFEKESLIAAYKFQNKTPLLQLWISLKIAYMTITS